MRNRCCVAARSKDGLNRTKGSVSLDSWNWTAIEVRIAKKTDAKGAERSR